MCVCVCVRACVHMFVQALYGQAPALTMEAMSLSAINLLASRPFPLPPPSFPPPPAPLPRSPPGVPKGERAQGGNEGEEQRAEEAGLGAGARHQRRAVVISVVLLHRAQQAGRLRLGHGARTGKGAGAAATGGGEGAAQRRAGKRVAAQAKIARLLGKTKSQPSSNQDPVCL